MDRKAFKTYKKQFVDATGKVLQEAHTYNLNEAAFPAYSNPNLLMNFLFWERIYHVMQYIEKTERRKKVLDFGCGSGVMLPFLAERAESVQAVDLELEPLRRLDGHISFAKNIRFLNTHTGIEEGSLDLIIALDVLEHVHNLKVIFSELTSLLKPNGEIIISGPTENVFYKLGRFFAGPTYSGHYHVRNIYDIRQEAENLLTIKPIITLYPPIPLFFIYTGSAKK